MNLIDLYEMRDRRDAYQRDYDNSVSGMGKRDSYAYSQDGGANDESHDLDPTEWYIVKDGKMFKATVYPNQVQSAMSQGYSPSREQAKAKADQLGVAEGSETPEKEIERLKLRQNAEHGGASLKRQAETQARIRELEKAQKNQGVATEDASWGMAEAKPVTIGSKLPKSDTATFGIEPGRGYKVNTPKDWKPGDRPRAIQQLIPTQDKKDHIRSRLGKHAAPVLPEQGVAEGSQRVDSLVTDALKIMQGATMNDAVAALKTVLGNREYNDRRGHYSFYVRQLMDMYGQQGMNEGKADYNFDIEDLKRLETIRDLSTLKTQALALISKPSAKPMKPEKVEWFKNALERMNSPLKVIKLMYDLLLSGEGNAVVGSRSSMNPNSYRQRFSEQGMSEADVDSDGHSVDHADSGEYDYEGDQAKDQLNTIVRAAQRLNGMLDDNENMPEWVQMKITNAADYIDTAADYIESNQEPELAEGDKIGNMDADKFDAAMSRLKQLAGAGPMKTVWDPAKRVYRNVPTAVQPRK